MANRGVVQTAISTHRPRPQAICARRLTKRTGQERKRRNPLTLTCAIAAGQFATDTFVSKYPKEIVESVHRTIPMGRVGESEEMAWLIAFLASDAGAFHSGSVITLDGGRDNWFGPWPPAGIADETGEPPSEARGPA